MWFFTALGIVTFIGVVGLVALYMATSVNITKNKRL